eukprot:243945-Chlamydomonas_euryale.AAC.1
MDYGGHGWHGWVTGRLGGPTLLPHNVRTRAARSMHQRSHHPAGERVWLERERRGCCPEQLLPRLRALAAAG